MAATTRTATTAPAVAEAARNAAVRALLTRPAEFRTVELFDGQRYTLVELVGTERAAVVDTLLPTGPYGIRPDGPYAHANFITTWAVYNAAPDDTRPHRYRAGAHSVLGYVMHYAEQPYAPRQFWAEYISHEQDDICHAGHERTLTLAVAAIVRQQANEAYCARKRLEAAASRALDVDPYDAP